MQSTGVNMEYHHMRSTKVFPQRAIRRVMKVSWAGTPWLGDDISVINDGWLGGRTENMLCRDLKTETYLLFGVKEKIRGETLRKDNTHKEDCFRSVLIQIRQI